MEIFENKNHRIALANRGNDLADGLDRHLQALRRVEAGPCRIV